MTIWARIAELAAAQPDLDAYVGTEGRRTYADLFSDVTAMARRIKESVPRDHVVAVSGQRGYGTLTCLLACLATGRVYLPMDERWPTHRVDLVVSEAGAAVVLEVAEDATVRVVPVPVAGSVAPHTGLAYVIFTSGSTGTPKGVMVAETVLEERLSALLPLLAEHQAVRFVLNTSISFDISLVELLLPLLAGGTIVCPPPLTGDPRAFADFVSRHAATHIQGTPSFFKLIEAFGLMLSKDLEMWCGGEALDARLAQQLVDRYRTVRNFYGPTEATIWCTFHTLTPDALGSVGLPFGGTAILAPGASAQSPGELILAAHGLAAGYLRPTDDEGRFMELAGHGRVYYTGDSGYLAADGRVHITGRVDDQVKVNGHRLELTEIESAVESHPDVRQCAAFVVAGSEEGSPKLAATYVVNGSVSVRELRGHLRRILPSYAVPQQLREVDAMPLTTAGKVDRQLLRANLSAASETERTSGK
ncbi:AMP-binding protein [Kitasatospora sp. NPDC048545]|uniref:AMP-binding protein n=1 Tax=Kitasatospora sp. NPDC048545 TaxID=3157208 RepID=UPI0033CFB4C1